LALSKRNPTEGRRLDPILCLVVERSAVRGDLARCVAAAVGAGVDWVQIRERDLEGAALLAHAEEIDRAARKAAAQRGGRVEIFVNRRIDIALALGANGVQLGFDAVDPQTARRLLGIDAQFESNDNIRESNDNIRGANGKFNGANGKNGGSNDRFSGAEVKIGISAHHPDEIRTAPPEVDCAQLAPIFQPLSKPHAGPYLGVQAVAEAARYDIPVIAQGGITPANATAIAAAGAAGIAVTGAILSAADPAAATRALRAALAAAPRSQPGTSPTASP
jgi:thiamine-phosphate pyrophosphorylase